MKSVLRAILTLASIILLLSSAKASSTDCKPTITRKGTQRTYDLTALSHPEDQSDKIDYTSLAYLYRVFANVCGVSSAGCDRTRKPAVCISTFEGDAYLGGLLSTQTFSDLPENILKDVEDGVAVKYTNGDSCDGTRTYETTLYFVCNDQYPEGFTYDGDENDMCSPKLYIYLAGACGVAKASSGGLGAGGIILIILAVLVVLYFGLGAVYQWKFKEAQTFPDFIIHREFWASIPGLVKDGVMFIAHGFKKGDYTNI